MKKLLLIIIATVSTSCIPLRIAPQFKKNGYTIKEAKKFNRKLPREAAFIFADPKDANEFFNFINTKFQLNDIDVDYDVPFRINETLYFLSFYEIEKATKTLNLLPLFIDGVTKDSNLETDMFDNYVSRKGSWYIVITILDKNSNNCLKESHAKRNKVLQYLKDLKQEYLTTQNYKELLFKKKP